MKTHIHSGVVLVMLLCLPEQSTAQAVRSRAFLGEPLGIGAIEVEFAQGLEFKSDQKNFDLTEANQRALHSVMAFKAAERKLASSPWIRQRPFQASVKILTVYFLFTGQEQLDLKLNFRNGREFRFTITPAEGDKRTAIAEWWKYYSARATRRANSDATGDAFEGYLSTMLSRRMQVALSSKKNNYRRRSSVDLTNEALGTLVGTQSIRAAMQKDRLLWNTNRAQKLDTALPKGVNIPEVPVPAVPENVAIESIAEHVPYDCFYIRCGSFKNFNWLRDNIDTLGSQLRNLVQRTTVDFKIQKRLEKQLAMKETALSRLLGGTVISDVALIGSDTFLSEGAGLGIVFEARQNTLLKSQIDDQRKLAAKAAGIEEQTLKIAGREVSLLNNGDQSIRSFYVIDGDYHLVSNSKKIVEDFVKAGAGTNRLADLTEFRHSRNLMKLKDNHTVFVYLSDPFFRRLLSPAVRTEMTRRIQALAEIEMVHFARVAASSENRKLRTVDQLIEEDFLPESFLHRSDYSKTQLVNGKPVDSLRGAAGVFVPVVDIPIKLITESERDAYQIFKAEYRRMWTRMDPVTIGITRQKYTKKHDKLVFQFHITPYVRRGGLGFLSGFLKANDKTQLKRIPGDLMGVELSLNALGSSGLFRSSQESKLFFGVREFPVEYTITQGQIKHDRTVEPLYYTGFTPKSILLNAKIKPDKDGYYDATNDNLIWGGDKYGRLLNDFRIASNSKEVLETVTPQAEIVPAARAAQLRMWFADLKKSKTYPALNAAVYLESRKSSAGAARLLTFLSDQLQVKPKKAIKTAESILGGELVCPLGGEFKQVGSKQLIREWRSSAYEAVSELDINSTPDDYRFPLLEWVHGGELEFNIDATTLNTRLELEVTAE